VAGAVASNGSYQETEYASYTRVNPGEVLTAANSGSTVTLSIATSPKWSDGLPQGNVDLTFAEPTTASCNLTLCGPASNYANSGMACDQDGLMVGGRSYHVTGQNPGSLSVTLVELKVTVPVDASGAFRYWPAQNDVSSDYDAIYGMVVGKSLVIDRSDRNDWQHDPYLGWYPSYIYTCDHEVLTAAATPTPPGGTTGSGNSCAHDVLTSGSRLTSSCSACVAELCRADAYCCSTNWDSTCVSEARAAKQRSSSACH
jgi:hypothetical protein